MHLLSEAVATTLLPPRGPAPGAGGAARGRAVADILSDADVQKEFLADVRGFARTYEAAAFSQEEKNLIKLRAFFDAKLPR